MSRNKKEDYHKEYYLKNKDRLQAQNKENYIKNKEAYLERSYEWRKKNPFKRTLSERKRFLKTLYNLSWEQYEELYNLQNGSCKICNIPLSLVSMKEEQLESACVDHCHTTGKIRGLLCKSCNLVLGNARESISILENSIKYLNDYADK